MGKVSTYENAAVQAKAAPPASEAKAATREGKMYAYQPPTESSPAPSAAPSKVVEQKQKVVSAFDDFMDALAEQVTCVEPAAPLPDPGMPADAGGTSGSSSGASGQPAATNTPGTSGASSGSSSGASTGANTGEGGQPMGGERPAVSEAARAEAEREAQEKSIVAQRSAYLLDRARETTRKRREQEADSGQSGAGVGPIILNPTSKHTPDSNRSPLTESNQWDSNFGALGRAAAPTIERIAVPNRRPETVPAFGTVNGTKPIDAYWGSFGTAIERAKARANVDHVVMEKIIGTDDRVRVTNNTIYPWRCICSLLITANTGAQYIGTGWLVSPRVVLTAGHCVFMSDEGGWVSQIEVIPGRNEAARPFGSAISREVRSVTGWTQDNDSNYDYGAILLPTDKRYGDQLGWFGYASRNDDYLEGLTLNLAGYPGDGGKTGIDGTQWYHSRTVRDVLDKQITYEIDTVGGQSGAPVWELASNGSRYGVAIHTFGDTLNNGGTRITGDVFDNIVHWATEAP